MKSNQNNGFEKTIKYKHIGFILELSSIIPMAVFHRSIWGYIISIPVFLTGVCIERKFRCPFCRYSFDPRSKLSDSTYCPKCGEKLNK